MKILKNFILSFLVFLLLPISGFAAENSREITLEYFGRDNCKHCAEEKEFLKELKEELPYLRVVYYDIKYPENKEKFLKTTEKAKLSKTTPLTFLGNTFIQGFKSKESTGERFKILIRKSLFQEKNISLDQYLSEDYNIETKSFAGATCSIDVENCEPDLADKSELIFDLPLIGTKDLSKLSIPTLSLSLGFIDGFNPCAMWVLIMFLTYIMHTGDKRKMFHIAGTFILAEAIMYYLILTVWMTAWDFVGLDNIVTKIVGLIAIGGGIFFLWEWKKDDGSCHVTSADDRKKTRLKIQEIIKNPSFIWSTIAILSLAFSVNIIEFACSIGIPQTFTKILDINALSFAEKHFYIFLYILAYMLDDLIVFAVAIYSFDKIGVMQKYSLYANFIGGLLMIILGTIMLSSPELLIF
jgi:cytochrome c biogenesis protein CcdA/glutaredoxin